FFYCYDDPLDLHSFPTRRSSDLMVVGATFLILLRGASSYRCRASRILNVSCSILTTLTILRVLTTTVGYVPWLLWRTVLMWRFRSEEHTSELQSRENLVCRLLLE